MTLLKIVPYLRSAPLTFGGAGRVSTQRRRAAEDAEGCAGSQEVSEGLREGRASSRPQGAQPSDGRMAGCPVGQMDDDPMTPAGGWIFQRKDNKGHKGRKVL